VRGLTRTRLLADPLAVDRIVDAMIAEDVRELADVGEAAAEEAIPRLKAMLAELPMRLSFDASSPTRLRPGS